MPDTTLTSNGSPDNPIYWYAVVKDEHQRLFIPLTGPFDNRADAEQACDNAFNRYCDERDMSAVFYPHGVLSSHAFKRSIYGTGGTTR